MNVNIVKNKFGRKSISFNHHGVDGEIVNEQKFYFK